MQDKDEGKTVGFHEALISYNAIPSPDSLAVFKPTMWSLELAPHNSQVQVRLPEEEASLAVAVGTSESSMAMSNISSSEAEQAIAATKCHRLKGQPLGTVE